MHCGREKASTLDVSGSRAFLAANGDDSFSGEDGIDGSKGAGIGTGFHLR